MKVEFVSFETTGLDSVCCDIMSMSICYDNLEANCSNIKNLFFEMAPTVEFEDEAVALHSKSGWLERYIANRKTTWGAAARARESADLRVLWAANFIQPFLQTHAAWKPFDTIDGSMLWRLATKLKGFEMSPSGNPEDKILLMRSALLTLRGPE